MFLKLGRWDFSGIWDRVDLEVAGWEPVTRRGHPWAARYRQCDRPGQIDYHAPTGHSPNLSFARKISSLNKYTVPLRTESRPISHMAVPNFIVSPAYMSWGQLSENRSAPQVNVQRGGSREKLLDIVYRKTFANTVTTITVVITTPTPATTRSRILADLVGGPPNREFN